MVNKGGNKLKEYAVYIVCITVLIFVVSLLTSLRSPKGLFGYTLRIVVSGSMEPTIMTDTVNVIRICDIDDIAVEDIICYRYDRDIIHRVTSIDNVNGQTVLSTKGDANKLGDNVSVTNDMVVGKVILTLNWTQYIISKFEIAPGAFDNKIIYKTLIIGIIALTFLSYAVKAVYNYIAICSYTFRGYTKTFQRVKRLTNNVEELKKVSDEMVDFSNERVDNAPETRITYIVHSLAIALVEFRIKRLNEKISNEKKFMHKIHSFGIAVNTFEKEMDKRYKDRSSKNTNTNTNDKNIDNLAVEPIYNIDILIDEIDLSESSVENDIKNN